MALEEQELALANEGLEDEGGYLFEVLPALWQRMLQERVSPVK
jgi:hypothetical protein